MNKHSFCPQGYIGRDCRAKKDSCFFEKKATNLFVFSIMNMYIRQLQPALKVGILTFKPVLFTLVVNEPGFQPNTLTFLPNPSTP